MNLGSGDWCVGAARRGGKHRKFSFGPPWGTRYRRASVEHPDLADSRRREPSVAGAAWCEPVRGGHPDAGLANRPGLEQLEAMLNGTTPLPPISRLTGMQLVEFGPGSAMFTMPV